MLGSGMGGGVFEEGDTRFGVGVACGLRFEIPQDSYSKSNTWIKGSGAGKVSQLRLQTDDFPMPEG